MDFFVYILLCNDNSYYIGHTDDIDQRIGQHMVGNYCTYTSKRRPIKLVFVENFASRAEAIDMERKLKKWTRRKKEALINEQWDKLVIFSKKNFKKNNPSIHPPSCKSTASDTQGEREK